MNIRNITPEDLPTLSKLTEDESLKSRTDICYEHSKLCLDDNGQIIAVVVLRQNAVSNFFNGEIPPEIISADEEYEDGDELLIKEDIMEINDSEHFEIIGIYASDNGILRHMYGGYIAYEDGCPIGIVWTPDMNVNNIIPRKFYNYNNIILLDIPDTD